MRKILYVSLFALFTAHVMAAAIPAKITYQGTLRKGGVPTTGPTTLTFNIYKDADTSVAPIWSTKINNVPVNQGLFSVLISPTGIDWQNVTPYIAVGVGDPPQMLGPAEPITATVYATLAGSVVDGAVTREKIDINSFQTPGPGLVPAGAILMFNGDCPSGWSPFAGLADRMPLGAGNLYALKSTGGFATHSHGIANGGAHSHHVAPIFDDASNSDPSGKWPFNSAPTGWKPEFPGSDTSTSGEHNHGGMTGSSSSLPPYYALVFCQKE